MTENVEETEGKKPWYKKWWVWVIAAVVVIGAGQNLGGKDDAPTAEEPTTESVEAPEEEAPAESNDEEPAPPEDEFKVTVMDLSADGTKFVSAEFPVHDAMTDKGIVKNLKEGCVKAIQEAKAATENWYEYDTVQCMGMSAWSENSIAVGSANFSGETLSSISDQAMEDSPEAFWDLSDRQNIIAQLQ